MTALQEGAVRKRVIPARFRERSARQKDIKDWAREELDGLEPDLSQETLKRILSGELQEVNIRPKKPGFFSPDGTFIEAFEYAPSIGGDLKEAEAIWSDEEQDRLWVDEENRRFNKTTGQSHPRIGQALWEHGMRIEQYARADDKSTAKLLRLLDRRRPARGYSRHTHQTSLDFYRWRPERSFAEHLFNWKWERVDSILRFSTLTSVRDHLTGVLGSTGLGELRDDLLSRLLGIKKRRADEALTSGDVATLESIRVALKSREDLDDQLIERAVSIVTKQTGN